MSRSRSWCFVSYHPEGPEDLHDNIKYIIFQQETCPKTKRLHWQGHVEFFTPIGYKSVQKCIGDEKAHVEIVKDRIESRAYCTPGGSKKSGPKDHIPGSQYERGQWDEVGQGRRSDFSEICDAIRADKPLREIANANPGTFARYHRGIRELRRLQWGRRMNQECEVIVLWGKGGAGKTHKANELAPNAYWKDNTKWWNDYNGEKEVIINDMMLNKWEPDYLKNMFDKWPMKIEDKGGVMELAATKFVITTNENPETWFQFIPELRRRVKKIEEFTEEYKP